MDELKLSLTIDETNLILEGLGNLPFVRVHQLVAKIQQQASSQLGTVNTPIAPGQTIQTNDDDQ